MAHSKNASTRINKDRDSSLQEKHVGRRSSTLGLSKVTPLPCFFVQTLRALCLTTQPGFNMLQHPHRRNEPHLPRRSGAGPRSPEISSTFLSNRLTVSRAALNCSRSLKATYLSKTEDLIENNKFDRSV